MSLHITVPTARLADGLGDLPADVQLSIWDLASPPPAPRLDLVVPPYMGGTAALRALDGVEVGLVQSQSIGYDGVSAHLPSGIRFANAASVHENVNGRARGRADARRTTPATPFRARTGPR